MRILGVILLAAGLVIALMGLVWVGQGSGYFPYPAGSFMIDQTPWIYRGLMTFCAGLIFVIIAIYLRS